MMMMMMMIPFFCFCNFALVKDACGSLCLARDDAADDADAEDACGWPPAAEDASGSLLPATSSDDGCLVFDH